MTMPNTKPTLDLAAMRERCERATAGPWWYDLDAREGGSHQVVHPSEDQRQTLTVFFGATGKDEDTAEADVRFTAFARTDLPALVDWCERAAKLIRGNNAERLSYAEIKAEMMALLAEIKA